jgi:hypothetical protein
LFNPLPVSQQQKEKKERPKEIAKFKVELNFVEERTTEL